MRRWIVWALLGVLIAAGVWILSTNLADMLPEVSQPQLAVELAASRIELTHGRQGNLDWRLTAVSSRLAPDGKTFEMASPNMEIFTDQGEKVILRAAKGTVNQETNTMRMQSEVIGVYGATTLNAEQLDYDGTRLLTASSRESRVRVVRNDASLLATTLTYDVQARHMTALGGVDLTLTGTVLAAKEPRK